MKEELKNLIVDELGIPTPTIRVNWKQSCFNIKTEINGCPIDITLGNFNMLNYPIYGDDLLRQARPLKNLVATGAGGYHVDIFKKLLFYNIDENLLKTQNITYIDLFNHTSGISLSLRYTIGDGEIYWHKVNWKTFMREYKLKKLGI